MSDLIQEKVKSFINIPEEITDLNEVPKLPITNIKGITKKAAATLRIVLKAKTIEQLSKVEISDEQLNKLTESGIKEEKLKNWLLISKLMSTTKTDDVFDLKKVVLVGLSNAGKTSILKALQNNLNLDLFGKIPATKGVNRESFGGEDSNLIVWDMGGQDDYRTEYLQNAEKYFLDIELMIFVMDVQDSKNFDKALDYLKDILKSLDFLKETPGFIVLLHKFDPDISDDPKIIESVQGLKTKLEETFEKSTFDLEIIESSIYNSLGKYPRIVNEIRNFLSTGSGARQDVVGDEFAPMLERVLNVMIDLSASIEDRFTTLEYTLDHVKEWIEYFRQYLPILPKKKKAESAPGKTLRQEINKEIKSLLKVKKLQ